MKRRNMILKICLTVLLAAVALSLVSCGGIIPGEKETTIFIATDLHLYSDNLMGEGNKVYLKENFTNDGRIQEYDYELVRTLVDEVNRQRPEFLVLTGDLSFNGELDSHLEIAKLLGEVNGDTQVLVIPGNHDTYSSDAVSVVGDKVEPTENIDADKFREIYSDFGYSEAYSYDENSLSYIYELDEDKWALMLDTTQSKYNEAGSADIIGGFVEHPTMLWLEENLKYAYENGISVVSFSHHNLLVHNELFKSNYTLYNYEPLIALLMKYGVRLNFSGHLHVQSIKNIENDGQTLYDVSGVSLLDYGNRYGRLEIYDNCYSYESIALGISEEMRAHSFEVFCREYYNKTAFGYQYSLGEEKGTKATELLSKINSYYFDGSYKQIHKLISSNRGLIKEIKENTMGYDSSYVKSIIDVPNEDQHKLVIER